jgi:hypothetical protein
MWDEPQLDEKRIGVEFRGLDATPQHDAASIRVALDRLHLVAFEHPDRRQREELPAHGAV